MDKAKIQEFLSQILRSTDAEFAFAELNRQRLIYPDIPAALQFYSAKWESVEKEIESNRIHNLYKPDTRHSGLNISRAANLNETRVDFVRHMRITDELCLVYKVIIGDDVTHDTYGRIDLIPYSAVAIYDYKGDIRRFFEYLPTFDRHRYKEIRSTNNELGRLTYAQPLEADSYIKRALIRDGLSVVGDYVSKQRMTVANRDASIFMHYTRYELEIGERAVGAGDFVEYVWTPKTTTADLNPVFVINTDKVTIEQAEEFKAEVNAYLVKIFGDLKTMVEDEAEAQQRKQDEIDEHEEQERRERYESRNANRGYPLHRPTGLQIFGTKPDPCLTTRDNLSFFERLARAIRNF